MDKIEEILITPEDSNIGYFVEVVLKYPDEIKQKTKNFQFCPENKVIRTDKYNEYMNEKKPKNYRKSDRK